MKFCIIQIVLIFVVKIIGGFFEWKEKNEEKMYIEPAQLTEEEEEIASLLGLSNVSYK